MYIYISIEIDISYVYIYKYTHNIYTKIYLSVYTPLYVHNVCFMYERLTDLTV